MNMNIYIRPDLERLLRQEPSMSGLINKLLDDYFQDPPTPLQETEKQKPKPQNNFLPENIYINSGMD